MNINPYVQYLCIATVHLKQNIYMRIKNETATNPNHAPAAILPSKPNLEH
jgi:hypothetical protein